MRRKSIIITILFCMMLTGCCLKHDWKDATCTEPKMCAKCGKTDGETIPHTWTDATCTAPKTCSVCGATDGTPAPHTWSDATCTAPKTCSVCGATDGDPAPHTWIDATTEAPATCSVCGETDGDPLPPPAEESDDDGDSAGNDEEADAGTANAKNDDIKVNINSNGKIPFEEYKADMDELLEKDLITQEEYERYLNFYLEDTDPFADLLAQFNQSSNPGGSGNTNNNGPSINAVTGEIVDESKLTEQFDMTDDGSGAWVQVQ